MLILSVFIFYVVYFCHLTTPTDIVIVLLRLIYYVHCYSYQLGAYTYTYHMSQIRRYSMPQEVKAPTFPKRSRFVPKNQTYHLISLAVDTLAHGFSLAINTKMCRGQFVLHFSSELRFGCDGLLCTVQEAYLTASPASPVSHCRMPFDDA